MKNLKTILKTLLFSTFMAVMVSTAGNTVVNITNTTESSIPVCCEECPDLPLTDSGH